MGGMIDIISHCAHTAYIFCCGCLWLQHVCADCQSCYADLIGTVTFLKSQEEGRNPHNFPLGQPQIGSESGKPRGWFSFYHNNLLAHQHSCLKGALGMLAGVKCDFLPSPPPYHLITSLSLIFAYSQLLSEILVFMSNCLSLSPLNQYDSIWGCCFPFPKSPLLLGWTVVLETLHSC